jgi:hypothetical protein
MSTVFATAKKLQVDVTSVGGATATATVGRLRGVGRESVEIKEDEHSCTCLFSNTTGMPCHHTVATLWTVQTKHASAADRAEWDFKNPRFYHKQWHQASHLQQYQKAALFTYKIHRKDLEEKMLAPCKLPAKPGRRRKKPYAKKKRKRPAEGEEDDEKMELLDEQNGSDRGESTRMPKCSMCGELGHYGGSCENPSITYVLERKSTQRQVSKRVKLEMERIGDEPWAESTM